MEKRMPEANKMVTIASDWDFASIAELTKALQSRKLSASELLEHTIARIEALDGRINAVVVRDFDRAKEAAKAADAALARGEQKTFLGIPVTLKEPFNVVGLPTTWGFPGFKDFVPSEDAACLQPQPQSADRSRVCRSVCRSLVRILKTARRSPSRGCSNGSSAASSLLCYRLRRAPHTMGAVGWRLAVSGSEMLLRADEMIEFHLCPDVRSWPEADELT
jgi:hypothetical protein